MESRIWAAFRGSGSSRALRDATRTSATNVRMSAADVSPLMFSAYSIRLVWADVPRAEIPMTPMSTATSEATATAASTFVLTPRSPHQARGEVEPILSGAIGLGRFPGEAVGVTVGGIVVLQYGRVGRVVQKGRADRPVTRHPCSGWCRCDLRETRTVPDPDQTN